MKYKRQLYQNMPVNLDQFKKDKEEVNAEDFQDESKIKELMNNVMCLTENEIKYQEELNKRKIVHEQKNNLIKHLSKKSRKVNPHLHEKTHFKGATSLVMSDTKVMRLPDESASNHIRQAF